ncbi:alpha-L-rhamnosidase C-terminal domain-containing protein [Verrucomicrobiaceae bacterium 227]
MKHGIFLAYLCSTFAALAAPIKVGNPKVENQVNPSGVSAGPRFSWHLISDERNKTQIAYQILAASSKELLTEEKADLWKGQLSTGSLRQFIPWGGKPLKVGQTVHWKVRVQDEKKEVGEWSPDAWFKVGDKVVLSKPARTSSFESSSPILNQLYADSIAQLQARIDKFSEGDVAALGNGAELQRSAREYLFNFDTTAHLTEWLRMMDAQRSEEGFFPIHPGAKVFGSVSSDAGITVTYPVWWMGGDNDFVKGRWEIFEKYMMAREKVDSKFQGQKWGEGFQAQDVTEEYTNLTNLGYTNRQARELAVPAVQPLNVIRFQDYAARVRRSFSEQYLNEAGSLKPDSQTAQLLALRCSVLPENQKGRKLEKNLNLVIADFLATLKAEGPNVGPTGAHYLLQVLPLIGHQNEAVNVLHKLSEKQRPAFIGTGTTEWMFSHLAGIDASSPGFQQIRIAPNIPTNDSITWVKAHHDSPAGRIEVRWEKLEDHGLKIDVIVPPGVFARMSFPLQEGQSITEGGKALKDDPNIEVARQSGESISLITKSGPFSFEIK